MTDSYGENSVIIQKTPSKLVVLYSFNILIWLLDELLEVKECVKHESEAGEALDLISIQIS